MKTHTSSLKNTIKKLGRDLDSKLTYTIGGTTTELGNEELNSVSPHYEGAILKSVMKQLDLDSNVLIPIGTVVNYQLGVKVNNAYEYLDYGNYIVYKIEKKEDTDSYKIICYDKMLYSMIDYKQPIGKNLFTGFIKGIRLNSTNGSAYDDNNGATSDFIPVDFINNSNYTISGMTTTLSTFTAVYNSNKVFLGRTGGTHATTLTVNQNSFVNGTPQGSGDIAYLRVTQYKTSNDSGSVDDVDNLQVQLEKGNTATAYRSYFKYPTTIRNYIDAICYDIGVDFANYGDTFANYDKQIASELYLDSNGNSLGYTFRDVLDELAEVTASTICINNNDKLEIRYINQTVGKNLLNIEDGTYLSGANEVTAIVEKGVISLSGTTTGNRFISIPFDYTFEADTYILSKNNAVANANIIVRLDNDVLSQSCSNVDAKKTQTFTQSTTVSYFVIRVASGTTLTNFVIKPQLEKGNTASPFEPYGDTIDEEYLKDINVNFGEKYGAINTIVLSRGGGADSIYYPSVLPQNPVEIKIIDNQIMNGNDRDTYMADIYAKLNGLEYYLNDFSSTGICYLELCDKYNVKVGDEFYSCIMFNDSVNITQGLEESVYTDMPEESVTDYKKSDSTDRRINTAYIIANKAEAQIEEVSRQVDTVSGTLNEVITIQDETSRTISVISTNIDANGNVTEVTTTTGFKLDANGLDIHKDDKPFHTTIDEDSTEYKDGDTVVSTTSKDGSALRQLRTIEQHYYSYNASDTSDIMNTRNYDFVDERIEDNGEYIYATFYNGED